MSLTTRARAHQGLSPPMDNEGRKALQAFFHIGTFIGVTGLALALLQPTDSPEFVVSICSAVMGGLLMVGVAIVVRVLR